MTFVNPRLFAVLDKLNAISHQFCAFTILITAYIYFVFCVFGGLNMLTMAPVSR